MSDDWGTYRSDFDDGGEEDETELGGEEPGGWPEDEPDAGQVSSGWADDESEPEGESPGGWPDPDSTRQRSDYGEAPGWQRSDEPGYDEYGYRRREELLSEDGQAEGYEVRHTRDPLGRLFPSLPRGVRVTLDWILTIAGAILIVLALKHWVVNPYRIPSSSMEPTLNCAKGPANPGCLGDSSDRVLACRICLDFGHNPSRGDIVVFNTPPNATNDCGEGGTFVKRVIGLPGDTIHETNKGFIQIKSPGSPAFVRLKEPYIPAKNRLADSQHFGHTWTVPANGYFMMGDNRAESCDSRTWGAVPRNKLIGIVFFVYWPPDRIGFR
jgi:signal peptidase I